MRAAALAALSFLTGVLTTVRADHYDDAFITYVFARNLASGHGIVWVPGDTPFYGPTSLLFTMLLALAGRLGLDLPSTSAVLGAGSWGAASALLFLLLRKWSTAAALGGALLAALTPLAADLSMGMEAGLFTALVLLALLLQQQGRGAAASLVAALASLTRPEGLLLFVVLFADAVRRPAAGERERRLGAAAAALAPGVLTLVAAVALELGYFGSALPQAVIAKSRFGCDVSGCFSPWSFAELLANHVGAPAAAALLAGASLGLARTVRAAEGRAQLLLAWSLLYAAALARAPSSPWYYAPLVPALFAAFAHGLAAPADPRRRWLLRAGRVALALSVAWLALSTARRVLHDPFGSHVAWNEEKRRLAAAVLNDMERGGLRSARVLAFEVGYLGYVVPGRVLDMLGLVTPGLQPCLREQDPDETLRRLDPDYILVIDEDRYRATACIHRALARSDRWTPLVSWPRPWGHNYVVFRRRGATIVP